GRAFGKDRPRGLRAMLRPPRSLSVTREGKWYIGILILIGIAAINTGNNLLYLVVAMLLSLIVISGIISEHTLRKLSFTRTWPNHIFKGEPTLARLSITSNKRRFSTFSIFFKEMPVEGCEAADTFILKLNPGQTNTRNMTYAFKRRGIYKLNGIKVSTRFPFGLFLKGREDRCADEVMVYPEIDPDMRLRIDESGKAQNGMRPVGKGDGAELYGLREYTLADSARFIYWKGMARSSRLLVKEFEQESEKRITIIFDNFKTTDAAMFERLVDETAATVNYLIERGFAVGLKTLTGEVKPAAGQAQLYTILRMLALIEPVDVNGVSGMRIE
ncbi:MAG: hypothetical protein A3J24_05970, partial [Deltaproteobacteria bacterium RIFCSPLOWO2_02_FULL_53_8]